MAHNTDIKRFYGACYSCHYMVLHMHHCPSKVAMVIAPRRTLSGTAEAARPGVRAYNTTNHRGTVAAALPSHFNGLQIACGGMQ